MTDTDIQTLRDRMATKVMGWVRHPSFSGWYKPVNDSIWYRRVNDKESLFAEYEGAWAPDLPTSPASQILGIVERMRESRYSLNLHEHPFMSKEKNRWSASFRNLDTKDYFEEYADRPFIAIMLAADTALGGE